MDEAFPSVGDQVRGSEGPLEQIINWFPAYVLVVPCKMDASRTLVRIESSSRDSAGYMSFLALRIW